MATHFEVNGALDTMDKTERKAHKNILPVICYPVYSLPVPNLNLLSRFRKENVKKNDEILVPPREARCFEVPLGGFFRITSIKGPQVGDLNLWHKGNKKEKYNNKTHHFTYCI